VGELRQDPISKSWSIIAPKRAKRPDVVGKDVAKVKAAPANAERSDVGRVDDPFAEGNEKATPKEVYRIGKGKKDTPGWEVRVIPNKFPLTKYHEVIIHSPKSESDFGKLPASQIEKIFQAYQQRYQHYEGMDLFPFIFCNQGDASGASLPHAHSQIVVLDDIPESVFEEVAGAEKHLIKEEEDVFGKVIQTEVELKTRIVKVTKHFVVLCPYESEWPYEFNIYPKMPRGSFGDCTGEELKDLAKVMSKMTKIVREKLDNPPYNFWIHSIPSHGRFASSSKIYRWHLEFILRTKKLGGVELGTKVMVDSEITPENAAKFYQKHYPKK